MIYSSEDLETRWCYATEEMQDTMLAMAGEIADVVRSHGYGEEKFLEEMERAHWNVHERHPMLLWPKPGVMH